MIRKALLCRKSTALRRLRNGNSDVIFKSQAEGSASTTSENDFDLLKSPAKKIEPPLLFPWRHDSCLPPRLATRKSNFTSKLISYEFSTQSLTALTARAYLGVPLLRLINNSWQREFAESCSFCFSVGVAGILSNIYEVPNESIMKNNETISVEFKSPQSAWNDENRDENSLPNEELSSEIVVESFMETKLRNLYSSAHESGRDRIEVYLSSKPTDSYLHSLHSLPGLSRSLAETHPKLIQELEQETPNRGVVDSRKFLDRVVEETGQLETTLIADVIVHCDEIFHVTDLNSGATVQGFIDGKVRQVVHGVRFERVMTIKEGEGRSWSNWIITDIDDLLDGNRWYFPAAVHWFHDG